MGTKRRQRELITRYISTYIKDEGMKSVGLDKKNKKKKFAEVFCLRKNSLFNS